MDDSDIIVSLHLVILSNLCSAQTTLSITSLSHYAECHPVECFILFIVMVNVIMLYVVMLRVVAPYEVLSLVHTLSILKNVKRNKHSSLFRPSINDDENGLNNRPTKAPTFRREFRRSRQRKFATTDSVMVWVNDKMSGQ
jgi:hypothetical protein